MSETDNNKTLAAVARADEQVRNLARSLKFIACELDRKSPAVKRAVCGVTGDAGLFESVVMNLDRQFRGESAQNLFEVVAQALDD